jgi:hypothetical protein
VIRGSGSTGAASSSLRTGAGDKIARTRGFRAGCSAEGAGSEGDGPTGCRLARRIDPLTIIIAGVVLLLPVVAQGLPRLFDYSRYRSEIHRLWQVFTAGRVPLHVKSCETKDSGKS